jgi:hypothetical protein
MTEITLTAAIERKFRRAIERRFQPSLLPYTVRRIGDNVFRCTDHETGSWVEGAISFGRDRRLHVIREHDATA